MQGDTREALEIQLMMLQHALEFGSRRLEGLAYSDIGKLCAKLGEFDKAHDYLRRALLVAESLGDQHLQATTLLRLGQLCCQRGEDGYALTLTEKSLTLAEAMGERSLEVDVHLALGRLLVRHDPERSLKVLRRALELATALTRPALIAHAHQALAELYEARAEYVLALRHYREYSELDNHLTREQAARRSHNLMLQLETENARHEAEIQRRYNVELAAANRALEATNAHNQLLLTQLRVQTLQLEQQALEDTLTGLHNRRYLEERLHEEFERARRYGDPLTVAVADIDHFKAINDTFSHGVGDQVLKTVAQILRRLTRQSDLCARYGGEEFVLAFPNTACEQGLVSCEKIRAAVADHPWHELHPDLAVTISIGLSSDVSAPHHEQLLALADLKLYDAKRSGRNRVMG